MGTLIGSTLVLFSIFCLVAAVWRELNPGPPPPQTDVPRIPTAVLVIVNGLLILVTLAVLAGIWASRSSRPSPQWWVHMASSRITGIGTPNSHKRIPRDTLTSRRSSVRHTYVGRNPLDRLQVRVHRRQDLLRERLRIRVLPGGNFLVQQAHRVLVCRDLVLDVGLVK